MIGRLLVVVLAGFLAVVPLPRDAVERRYSTDLYPRIQEIVTPATNFVPVALLDVAVVTVLLAGLWVFARRWRAAGGAQAVVRTAGSALVAAAIIYLAFLMMWGLNYRRLPLEQKLEYDTSRVTRASVARFASDAATRLNRGHTAAHAQPPDVDALARAFAEAQRALGASRTAVVGVPKQSLLTFYFRAAGFDGMTDPLFLEIIVNPDVLPVERPFVLAHEWAHLAGYADESEANYVAWLTCARGDALASYSGWLTAYQQAAGALPQDERRALVRLDAGPRADFAAIAARYQRAHPAVRDAARQAYDRYLRANRVEEGIHSYDEVLRLMVGVRLDKHWTPTLRR